MNVVGFALKKILFVEMNNKQKADFIQANGQCHFFFFENLSAILNKKKKIIKKKITSK